MGRSPRVVEGLHRRAAMQVLCTAAWLLAPSQANAKKDIPTTEGSDVEQDSLAKIAVDGADERARCAAAGGIQDLSLLERVIKQAPPTEQDHIGVILALRKLLYETKLADRLGPTKISIDWSTFTKDAQWTKYGSNIATASLKFEKITITVFRKSNTIARTSWSMGDYSKSWDAPIRVGLIPAPITFIDLLPDIWNACEGRTGTLKQSTPVDPNNLGATRGDQGRLAWSYLHNGIANNYFSPAADYLTDQSVIAFITLHEIISTFQPKDPIASNMLSNAKTDMWIKNDFSHANYPGWLWAKLTNQEILARIAIYDSNATNRLNATRKLQDSSVLEKVAKEDPDASVRSSATARQNSLTEPSR
jgi:hypothetical protein